jgi:dihydroorotase
MPDRVLLRAGRIVDPESGRDEAGDVLVSGGTIEAVTAAGEAPSSGARVVECEGLVVAPGLVDMHTHLREPGGEDRETIQTGTRAAAAGGYTAVSPMANTEPVADGAAVVEEVLALGRAAGHCDLFPVAAITKGQEGASLVEMGELVRLGVRAFSDDGRCVTNAQVMRTAMEYSRAFDAVLAQHAQDPDLTEGWQMHEGPTSSLLGLSGAPSESEEAVVARDLLLARLTGARIHFCHLSSKGSVQMVAAAKGRGVRVTAEVTPHHLTFTDEDLLGYDTNFKVNPPLRSETDRDALVAALADGSIDVVATDHAPHAAQDKEREFDQAPPGMIGLETALGAVMTRVAAGSLTITRAVEAMSTTPARLIGATEHGGPIAAGRPANLVVFDPEAEWKVEAPFVSRSSNSAFIGRTLRGRVLHTMLRGAFTCEDGEARR